MYLPFVLKMLPCSYSPSTGRGPWDVRWGVKARPGSWLWPPTVSRTPFGAQPSGVLPGPEQALQFRPTLHSARTCRPRCIHTQCPGSHVHILPVPPAEAHRESTGAPSDLSTGAGWPAAPGLGGALSPPAPQLTQLRHLKCLKQQNFSGPGCLGLLKVMALNPPSGHGTGEFLTAWLRGLVGARAQPTQQSPLTGVPRRAWPGPHL